MLDFDGDCMSDLFLTTRHGGENYYEFYMRRERTRSVFHPATATSNTTEPTEMTGFSSFCLVSREKLSSITNNMVGFQDIDRDGMVDMFYSDSKASSDGINLYIHYNKLENADKSESKNQIESAF